MVRDWPGIVGYKLRSLYYRARFKHVGKGVIFGRGLRISGHQFISVDDNSYIDDECMIIAGPFGAPPQAEIRRVPNRGFNFAPGEVVIGKHVHLACRGYILGCGGVYIGDCGGFAGGCRLLSLTNHYASFKDPSKRDMYALHRAGWEHSSFLVGPIVLERNVALGSNAVILPGALIRQDSFVAINSLVWPGVVPQNSVVAGNPAVKVKPRFADPPTPPADVQSKP